MKILFNLKVTQPVSGNKRHGGGKYGEIVLKRIIQRNLPIVCSYDSTKWLNPEIEKLLNDNKIKLFDLSKQSFQEIINQEKIDIIFESCNLKGSQFKNVNCKIIGVIHGLRIVETPTDYSEFLYKKGFIYTFKAFVKLIKPIRNAWGRLYINNSLFAKNIDVITVSKHSQKAFKCYFPNYKKDIPCFYSPSTSGVDEISTKYNEKYFLLVSANRPEKNNLRAIKAFDKLFTYYKLDNFRVKITGVDNPRKTYRYKIKNPDKFDFLGYVDELELNQLYHDAYCFVYPTLNEGFGYPPLEAMHYSVPVLTSPLSSIPEICGGSVIYFNPFSVEEIMNRILMIIDNEIHNKYSLLGKERYKIITTKQNEDLDNLINYIYDIK